MEAHDSDGSSESADCLDADDDIRNEDLAIATPFDGDLFGTAKEYNGEDFGQGAESEDEESEGMPEEEIEEAAERRLFDLQLEDSWEPARNPDVPEDHGAVHLDDDDEDPSALHDFQLAEQRLLAEERADFHPQIVRYSETYPSSRAGYVVASAGKDSDMTYASSVNGQSNIWAPFTSELDWKVARWAKLRGAGSTAFSDLLAIDGVRIWNFAI
jgi:hypothetical protein